MQHKSGFVNIIGNPNVGKSTLMNKLVGEKVSIITSKAQTTRHRIKGIVNGEDFQIVYSDTPGILNPQYKLQESMLNFVNSALSDADVILYVTDMFEKLDKNERYLQKIKDINVPVILVLNKIDLSDQEEVEKQVEIWKKELPKALIFPASALTKFNVAPIFDKILELIPESPPYFSKDDLTDKTERFFISEIIREKVLLRYQKEIPYSVEIVVEEFKVEEKIIKIRTIIYVARESQKGIVIGHKGLALKQIGTQARRDIQEFLNKKVYLELYVKVSKDWRNKPNQLRDFGYL